MKIFEKIEKLEDRLDKAHDKTIPGATANRADKEKAEKQVSKLDAQLQALYKKIDNNPKWVEKWEEYCGCEWDWSE